MTSATRTFWAWVLILAGGLITALCGTCTAVYVGGSFFDLLRGGDVGLVAFIVVSALVVGGLPILVGALLLRWGLKLRAPRPAGPRAFD